MREVFFFKGDGSGPLCLLLWMDWEVVNMGGGGWNGCGDRYEWGQGLGIGLEIGVTIQ